MKADKSKNMISKRKEETLKPFYWQVYWELYDETRRQIFRQVCEDIYCQVKGVLDES